MSPSGDGQECRHEFPVDAMCAHCETMLSGYVQRLKQRASNLEREARAAWEQTRKMEGLTDSYRQATIEALEDCFASPEPTVEVMKFLRALQQAKINLGPAEDWQSRPDGGPA